VWVGAVPGRGPVVNNTANTTEVAVLLPKTAKAVTIATLGMLAVLADVSPSAQRRRAKSEVLMTVIGG
jgi:hypothetical protein